MVGEMEFWRSDGASNLSHFCVELGSWSWGVLAREDAGGFELVGTDVERARRNISGDRTLV